MIYCREKLIDTFMDHTDIHERIDTLQIINRLLETEQISAPVMVRTLYFLCGADDVEYDVYMHSALCLLANELGWTDAQFIEKTAHYYQVDSTKKQLLTANINNLKPEERL